VVQLLKDVEGIVGQGVVPTMQRDCFRQHSKTACEPLMYPERSCKVKRQRRTRVGWVRRALLAVRDIETGEELSISYIDENTSISSRTNALADYGFVCTCAVVTSRSVIRAHKKEMVFTCTSGLARQLPSFSTHIGHAQTFPSLTVTTC